MFAILDQIHLKRPEEYHRILIKQVK